MDISTAALATMLVAWGLGYGYLWVTGVVDRRNYEPFLAFGASFRPARVATIAIAAFLSAEIVLYLLDGDIILYDAQAGSLIATFRWVAGMPLYQSPDDPERYSLLYGPLTFALYAPAAFVKSVWLAKAIGVAVFLGAVAVLAYSIRTLAKTIEAKWAWAFAIAFVVAMFPHNLFTSRADAALLLLTAASVATIRTRYAFVTTMVLAAIAMNFKITAPLYFLPTLTYLVANKKVDLPSLLIAVHLAALVAIAPFLLLPGVAIRDYLYWLHASADHALRLKASALIGGQIILAAALPIHFLMQNTKVKTPVIALGWALLASSFFYAVIAFKVGAGPYHFAPLAPVFGFFLAQYVDAAKEQKVVVLNEKVLGSAGLGIIVLMGLLLITFSSKAMFIEGAINEKIKPVTQEMLAELEVMSATHGRQGGFAIAPDSSGKNVVNAIPSVLAYGAAHLVNEVAEWDMHEAKIPFSTKTVDAIKKCSIKTWAVRKGGEPFKADHLYRKNEVMFKPIRDEFLANYAKTSESKFFDLWTCKPVRG